MEVNEKKQILKTILQKLFVGLIFCCSIIGFNMTLNQSTVKADKDPIIKNLTFVVMSERPLDFKFPGYNDSDDGHSEVDNWNDYKDWGEDRGTIQYTETREWEDGMYKYKYIIEMIGVNVTNRTPWMRVSSTDTSNYYAEGFYYSSDKQGCGLSSGGNPHYTGDVEIDDPDYIQTYMGLAFCEKRIDVKIGYNLGVNWNGGTHPALTVGKNNVIAADKNSAVWKNYFHHIHTGSGFYNKDETERYYETGKIPSVYGKGSVTRTGYNFDGWYCGTKSDGTPNYLFDADGNPNESVWIGEKKWSDSTLPKYMWGLDGSGGGTVITAHWTAKKYNLTLHYMGAEERGKHPGAKEMDAMDSVYKDWLTYDGSVKGIYGQGTVKRTGYTFNGWYIEDSSKKKVYLWDKNGNLTNKNITFNGSSWTIDGKYKFTGNTEVYADWIPNKYNLTVDYNGADTHPEQTKWEPFFTYDQAISEVFGKGTIKKIPL